MTDTITGSPEVVLPVPCTSIPINEKVSPSPLIASERIAVRCLAT
jgi:hypothetical protein